MKAGRDSTAARASGRLPYLLIAQHDGADRETMRDVLSPRFEIKTVCDGFEVLSQVLERKPDLVLLDLALPGIPGLEVIHALQSTGQDISVIATVGADRRSEDWLRANIMGAGKLLRRPVSADELTSWVDTILSSDYLSTRSPEAADAAALLLDHGRPKVVDESEFRSLLERAQRMDRNYDQVSSVLLMQARNDTLRDRVTTIAAEVLRSGDFIFPYRSERLAVLLPLTECDRVPAILARLEKHIEEEGGHVRQLRCGAMSVDDVLRCQEWSLLFSQLVPWS